MIQKLLKKLHSHVVKVKVLEYKSESIMMIAFALQMIKLTRPTDE